MIKVARIVNVNFHMDADLKKDMEKVCGNMGMSMTTAFTIFAKKVSRESRIPFEVSGNHFYSESNIRYLEKIMQDIKDGKARFAEHDLSEDK
ncbi:MAG: type II toxin-antitoxin system RelB/DinJ family antitoxin [Phascolarctobacterium sp.]|nr:type II toxin-antitoxin system RelB/DinJ family antitoxin [Phascolarctobacterium sp.]